MTNEEKKQVEDVLSSFENFFEGLHKTVRAQTEALLKKYCLDSSSEEKKIKKEVEQDDCNTQSDY